MPTDVTTCVTVRVILWMAIAVTQGGLSARVPTLRARHWRSGGMSMPLVMIRRPFLPLLEQTFIIRSEGLSDQAGERGSNDPDWDRT
jgi:hypothetical protein